MNFIVFHDGTAKEVGEKEAEIIIEKSCNRELQGVKIGSSFYKFSSISKIMTSEDYYSQYPNKRPHQEYNQFEDMYGKDGNQQMRQPTSRAGELLRQGFLQYHLEQKKSHEDASVKFAEFNKRILNYIL